MLPRGQWDRQYILSKVCLKFHWWVTVLIFILRCCWGSLFKWSLWLSLLKIFMAKKQTGFFKQFCQTSRIVIISNLAGCRALGLIDKVVSGPLWRKLVESSASVLQMSSVYTRVKTKFETWSQDSWCTNWVQWSYWCDDSGATAIVIRSILQNNAKVTPGSPTWWYI